MFIKIAIYILQITITFNITTYSNIGTADSSMGRLSKLSKFEYANIRINRADMFLFIIEENISYLKIGILFTDLRIKNPNGDISLFGDILIIPSKRLKFLIIRVQNTDLTNTKYNEFISNINVLIKTHSHKLRNYEAVEGILNFEVLIDINEKPVKLFRTELDKAACKATGVAYLAHGVSNQILMKDINIDREIYLTFEIPLMYVIFLGPNKTNLEMRKGDEIDENKLYRKPLSKLIRKIKRNKDKLVYIKNMSVATTALCKLAFDRSIHERFNKHSNIVTI